MIRKNSIYSIEDYGEENNGLGAFLLGMLLHISIYFRSFFSFRSWSSLTRRSNEIQEIARARTQALIARSSLDAHAYACVCVSLFVCFEYKSNNNDIIIILHR